MIFALLALVSLSVFPASAIEIATGSMLGPRYKSDRFYVRGSEGSSWQLTYSGAAYRRQARGKLMLVRLAQSLFDDERLEEQAFDPDRNTQHVIDALDFYKQHGVLAISVGLQGDNPRYGEQVNGVSGNGPAKIGEKKGALVSAFRSDGSLKPEWLNRLERLLTAANERGMVVCLVYFHPGQDGIFESPNAIALDSPHLRHVFVELLGDLAWILLPLMGLLVVLALVASVGQTAPATASTARTSAPAIGPQPTAAASAPASRRNNSAGNNK